jgi:hypothetical protein
MAVTIKDASNANVDVASAPLGGVQVPQIGWAKASRGDTFTATGTGTAVDVSGLGMSQFGIQVKATGAVDSWTAVVEVSLDGTNYVTVLTHTNLSDGDGAIKWSGANEYPALYFRSHCTELTLGSGTNVIVTIIGKP